ncbi:MAG: C25 family peptidase propeptide domain-containing protein [Caldilineales bacterium]
MTNRLLPRVIALFLVMVSVIPGAPALAAASGNPESTPADLVVQSSETGVMVHLTTPAWRLQDVERDGRTFQEVALDVEDWWQAGDAGSPQLPERSVMLAVPPAGQISLASVDIGQATDVSDVAIQPAPEVMLVDDALQSRWSADRAAYAADAWQPASAAEIVEEGWLRGVRFVRVALRPFQFNPARSSLRVSQGVTVHLRFEQPVNENPAPADPLYAPVFRSTFANYEQAVRFQTAPDRQDRQPPAGPWVKVTANHDGLYRVTYNDLLASGLSAATLATIAPATLRLLDEGVEQAVFVAGAANGVFDPGDYVLFYARRNRSPHSDDNNVYWLTWGGANGLRMTSQNVAPASAAFANTLLTTAHAEQNLEYHAQRPFTNWLQPVPYDHWYWSYLNASMPVTLDNLKVNTASSVAPVASVWLAGDKQLAGNYTLSLRLNGQPEQLMTWTTARVLTGQKTLPAGAGERHQHGHHRAHQRQRTDQQRLDDVV